MAASFVLLRGSKPAPRKPAAKRNAAPEYSVQVACYRYLKAVLPDAFVYAVENAAQPKSDNEGARMAFHAKRKNKGIHPGVPDLHVLMPGPVVLAVECKAPGGVVSEAQQDVRDEVLRRGGIWIVADGVESLRWELRKAGIAIRETLGQPAAPARVRWASRAGSIDNASMPF
jgi:hypothetical protein